MSQRGPFPTTIDELSRYFATVIAFLNDPANTGRLSIQAASLSKANKLYSNPAPVPPETIPNDLGFKELLLLHFDPKTNTTIISNFFQKRIRKHLASDPDGLENVLREIYANIPASALTDSDRKTLHLPKRKARSSHGVATKNIVDWTTVALGGGDVLTKCTPSGPAVQNPSANTQRGKPKATRPHKEAGYEIRTAYVILAHGVAPPTLGSVPDLNKPLPAGSNWNVRVDTKARLVIHLGNVNEGNVLYEFKQWHNPKHPELDGPLTGPRSCTIT